MHISPTTFRQEFTAQLALLGPILLSQLSQAAFGFVDAVMAGQVSPLDLAAVALGAGIWLPLVLLVSGILMATTPLVAAAHGRRDNASIPAIVHQALWLTLFLSIVGIVVLRNISPVFDCLNTPENLRDMARRYLEAIAWGLPAMGIFTVLRSYCESLGLVVPVMVVSILGLLLNIPVNYIFIHGKFGLPALGGVGCGWASTIVMWAMVFGLLSYVLITDRLKDTRLSRLRSRPEWAQIAPILRLGLPMGIAIFFEVSVFALVAVLISPLGELQVAGHQIALSVTSLLFMFPLSLAFCLTIRSGQAYGRQDMAAIHLIRRVGLISTAIFACFSATFIVLCRDWLISLYTKDAMVAALAAQLLLFAAAYQIVDALQVGAAGCLRGLQDTKGPMVVTLIAYWLIAMPLGYTLGMTHLWGEPWGPHGFWTGLVVGLTVSSVLLLKRLSHRLKHLPFLAAISEQPATH